MFRDHMLKAKRLTNFRLPYVVLMSKFIEYFGIDVEDELEELIGLLNHTSNQNLHKMGFLKVGNGWITFGVVVGGAHDHEVGPSSANQEEEPTVGPMDLIPYNPLEDRGPVYSHFERMVLNQLHELNVSQHAHHNYCNGRFNALDGQIHDIHDMLNSFQTRNDAQDNRVCWLFRIMHCIHVFVLFQFQLYQFQLVVFHFNRLIISTL